MPTVGPHGPYFRRNTAHVGDLYLNTAHIGDL